MNRVVQYTASCIIMVIITTACANAARLNGPYEGKIIDADTGHPIEGVVVLGVWTMETITPGGATTAFYNAQETLTDKKGAFRLHGLGRTILSNITPMNVLVFKAGYRHFGYGPWAELKDSDYLIRKLGIKWEGNKVTLPLKKLSMEERRKLRPPYPPTSAPLNKVRLMLQEINKNETELGARPLQIWGGEKL